MSERNFSEYTKSLHPEDKMLFLAGPRQVGKTTIANQVLNSNKHGGLYLNYDIPSDRKRIISSNDLLADVRQPNTKPMVIFDEIHKMAKFKAFLKGFYDENKNDVTTWVTGSGRLDLFQRGGDSLLGRYFLYHLHPFTIGEISNKSFFSPDEFWTAFTEGSVEGRFAEELLEFGGFPEPFLKQEKSFYRRWVNSRKERIIREDIRDLTRIQELDKMEKLVEILPSKVGSPLSINSMREDIGVAFETVDSWINALERVYYIFQVLPYSSSIARSIKKEKKLYFWDWSQVPDKGARFENFCVSHFYKTCDMWNDFGIADAEIRYIRDREKREVDILLLIDKKPFLLIEIKNSDTEPSPHLLRFGQAIGCDKLIQIVNTKGLHKYTKINGQYIHIVSPDKIFPLLV